MLLFLSMLGCITGCGDDDGDSLDFKARMQVWCANSACSKVGIYGGNSGKVDEYSWYVDGTEVDRGESKTSYELDLSQFGRSLVEVKLQVFDGDKTHSGVSMLIGATNVYPNGAADVTAIAHTTASYKTEPMKTIIVIPPPVSCEAAAPVASIGGCLQGSIPKLFFEAKDTINGAVQSRAAGVVEFEINNQVGNLRTMGFAESAAWDLVSPGNPSTQQMLQYALNSPTPPIVIDDSVSHSSPASFTPHFTFWFKLNGSETVVTPYHTAANGTDIEISPISLQTTCNTAANQLVFSLVQTPK